MNEKTNKQPSALRFSLASMLCLTIGVRFYSMGDPIGTVIYGASTAFCLLAAFVHYVKRE